MTQGAIRVALPWHSLGHANLGVDALTRANMAILRAAAARVGRPVRFTTLCSTGAPASLPEDVAVGPMPRIKPLLTGRSDYLAALRAADLVVDIGEGDSWTDIYGGRRFAFHAGTKVAALALGRPLVLAPQTIGPFGSPWRARLADAIMNRARAVFSRDGLSTAYLAGHGIRAETGEFIDVAFRLPFEPAPKAADGTVRVGLNVSGLLYNGGYTGRNELGLAIDYPDYTRRLIAALLERPGVEVHLVPHVLGSGGNDDDRSVVPELTARFPALRVPAPFADASAAKSFLSGLDFVVGGRMHACIGAFSAGVPVVPVAYSRKFNGLFGTLGYPHLVDGRQVNADTALGVTLAAFDDRPRLAADLERGLAIAADRLGAYEDRLAAILAALP